MRLQPPPQPDSVRVETRLRVAPRVSANVRLPVRVALTTTLPAPEPIAVPRAEVVVSAPLPPTPLPSTGVTPPSPTASPRARTPPKAEPAPPSQPDDKVEPHRDLAAILEDAARTLASGDATDEQIQAALRMARRHLERALRPTDGDEAHAQFERARALQERQAKARMMELEALHRKLAAERDDAEREVATELRQLQEAQMVREREALAGLELLITKQQESQQRTEAETRRRAEAIQRQLMERQQESVEAAKSLQRAYEQRLRKLEEEYRSLRKQLEEQEAARRKQPPG